MNSPKLIICADANERIGIGHFMRSLAIGCQWQSEGGQVLWVSDCQSSPLLRRLEKLGMAITPHTDNHLKIIESHAPDWVILDGYHFDDIHQQEIRQLPMAPKLLVIDDTVRLPIYHTDILLNPNLNAESLSYTTDLDSRTKQLLGIRYNLLRPEFLRHGNLIPEQKDTARNILITLGGADPHNHTLQIIQFLQNTSDSNLQFRIALGPSNPHQTLLEKQILADTRFKFVETVENMPEEMLWADMAITAGGSTCWEMAYLQLPMLTLQVADNQAPIVQALSKEGITIHLGTPETLMLETFIQQFRDVCFDSKQRLQMAMDGRKFIDGQGVARVIDAMLSNTA